MSHFVSSCRWHPGNVKWLNQWLIAKKWMPNIQAAHTAMYNYYPSYLFQEKKLYCLPLSKEQGNSPLSLQSRAIFALLFAARIDQNISSPSFYGVIISMAQWIKLGVYLIYNFLWNNKTKTNCQKNFLTYKLTYFFFLEGVFNV